MTQVAVQPFPFPASAEVLNNAFGAAAVLDGQTLTFAEDVQACHVPPDNPEVVLPNGFLRELGKAGTEGVNAYRDGVLLGHVVLREMQLPQLTMKTSDIPTETLNAMRTTLASSKYDIRQFFARGAAVWPALRSVEELWVQHTEAVIGHDEWLTQLTERFRSPMVPVGLGDMLGVVAVMNGTPLSELKTRPLKPGIGHVIIPKSYNLG